MARGVAEYGLNFVALSAERSRYDLMLERMFGNAPDGVRDPTDRLLQTG